MAIRLLLLLLAFHPLLAQTPVSKAFSHPFANAAQEGNVKALRAMLAAGVPIDQRWNEEGETALGDALRLNHWAAAQVLLEAGARPEKLFSGDYHTLAEGVRRGDHWTLERVMGMRPDDAVRRQIYSAATLLEDSQMLVALAKWNVFQLGPNNPLAIAVVFRKYKSIQTLMAQAPRSPEGALPPAIFYAVACAGITGDDRAARLIAEAAPGLITFPSFQAGDHDLGALLVDFQRQSRLGPLSVIVLGLPPGTLKRLWSSPEGHPAAPELDRPGAIESRLIDEAIEDSRIPLSLPCQENWRLVTKLMAMGGRPTKPLAFRELVGALDRNGLTFDEFKAQLQTLGPWLLEPDPEEMKFSDPRTGLRCQAILESPNALRALIQAFPAFPRWRDPKGRSLLHHAALGNATKAHLDASNLAAIATLGKIDINALDTSGKPALAYVTTTAAVQCLLDLGASPVWPKTPEGHLVNEWIYVHRERGELPDPTFFANSRVVALINQVGGTDQRTPLTAACELAQTLNTGADCGVGMPLPTKDETEAAKRAACLAQDPLVTLLLEAGADANQRDGRGWTPARAAAESGDVRRLRSLAAHPDGLRGLDRQAVLKALQAKAYFTRTEMLTLLGIGKSA